MADNASSSRQKVANESRPRARVKTCEAELINFFRDGYEQTRVISVQRGCLVPLVRELEQQRKVAAGA